MSIDLQRPPRMPQPEQWMSEHPFQALLICFAIGWLLGFVLDAIL